MSANTSSSRTCSLAIVATLIACSGPAQRSPQGPDEPPPGTPEQSATPEATSIRASHPRDAADAADAHHAPPATTSASGSPSSPRANSAAEAEPDALPELVDEAPLDMAIKRRLRRALLADGSLSRNARSIQIGSRGGKVTLSGVVGSENERSAIEDAVKRVEGVVEIDSQLVVESQRR